MSFLANTTKRFCRRTRDASPICLQQRFTCTASFCQNPVRTLNPEEADWFYKPVYTTCDLTPNGFPLPFKSPTMMRSAIQLISSNWPYWNRTDQLKGLITSLSYLMILVHAFTIKKIRPLREGFFHCSSVLPWFKLLDSEIMCA